MPKIYYEADCDINVFKGKTVVIIGYDSQGRAHVLNLHDSRADAVVGSYEGSKSAERAKEAGLKALTVPEVTKTADIITTLISDERQAEMYKKDIEPNLTDSKAIVFAHGFNIRFGQIKSPKFVDAFMIAPKSPGHAAHNEFQEGRGVSCFVAVEQDHTGHALGVALAYGAGIDGVYAAMMETIFRVETETGLFGEQVVLCGGVCALMKVGLEMLVEAGYALENAYFECTHEMKLIVDLTYKGDFELMRYSISDTAEFGDYESDKRLITDDMKKEMKQILSGIQDGTLAGKWITGSKNGRVYFGAMRRIESEYRLEPVGKELRRTYSWSEEDKYADQSGQDNLINNAIQYR